MVIIRCILAVKHASFYVIRTQPSNKLEYVTPIRIVYEFANNRRVFDIRRRRHDPPSYNIIFVIKQIPMNETNPAMSQFRNCNYYYHR